MLRGEVPQDRNPQEIVFDRIEDVDDTWTQLFFTMLGDDDKGELWYWHGTREKQFAPNFVERWVPSFETYGNDFDPDVIWCRGGFPQYHPVLNRFPKAIKIFYGAGKRFLPQPGFLDYDIILQDSPAQQAVSKKRFPAAVSTLYIKPAPDNLFYPIEGIKKEYDICFPADGRPVRKGHDFIYPTLPQHFNVLNLGFPTHHALKPHNVTSYRVLKPEMAKHMQKCNIGIIASTIQGKMSWDSCPRTLPEMLACGIPVVVLDELEFWQEKYITPMTGEMASRENYWEVVQHVLDNRDKYNPRKHYEENLTVRHAADHLLSVIREVINERSV
jgi:hypothetical protein